MAVARSAVAVVSSLAAAALGLTLVASPAAAGGGHGGDRPGIGGPSLRVATFNASLNRAAEGELVVDLSTPDDPQAATIAEILQRNRPDVVLLNEFDYVPGHVAVDLFRENYLEVPQGGAQPIDYPYAFVAPSNTGVPSGFDLDNDGTVGGGNDALGFGEFEGQYGMVVLSRYPIEDDDVRTFQQFLWKDMPGALLPDDPATPEPADWYTPEELDVVRLSSKSHWDVPVRVGRDTVHVLASHPTPPTFDGAEDRNGRRNHDEIRFWADYVTPGRASRYIVDDDGDRGGLAANASFVVLGDQNADPLDGDSVDAAIDQLLDHRRITDPLPASDGAVEASALQGGANADHSGDPALDTADFADTAPGNLRADYVLPSRDLRVRDARVFWPEQADPLSRLTGVYPFPSSDHRLVYVDLGDPVLGAPLAQAHAHNDYEHDRPLYDALQHGFTSVEADVWLVDGELLVAHDAVDLDPGRTLESLYLDPLDELVRGRSGSVYPGWDGTFQLLIDIKTEAESTYAAIEEALADHGRIFASYSHGRVRDGAIQAVVSGNRPLETMQTAERRYAFYDGRSGDVGSGLPASLMPLVSDNWANLFTWRGVGEMPAAEREALHAYVAQAHDAGYRVRFWNTPDVAGPARDAIWAELSAAGVDHINTDDLAGLEAFLEAG